MVDIQIHEFLKTKKSPGPIYRQKMEDFQTFKIPSYAEENTRTGKVGHHRSQTQVMSAEASN
jgi:hypothetical protein